MVSIIVPCFNQGEYVRDTLMSISEQTYSDWECLVVNDGSVDDSADIIHEFCGRDGRFIYIGQPNLGVCNARNVAISRSKGKYLLPLDADDIISPTYIEKAVAVMERNPEVKLVYSLADKFGLETGRWFLPEYEYEKLLWNNILFCSSIFRRSDFDKTGGYNANMVWGCEDWDFWLSFLHAGDIVYRIDEVLFHYRIKEVSRTTESKKRQSLIYRQIIRNHIELYSEYIDQLIPMRNDLYWERVKKESYYRHSLARVKDLLLRVVDKVINR